MGLFSFFFGNNKKVPLKKSISFDEMTSFHKKRFFFDKAGFIGILSYSNDSNYVLLRKSCTGFYDKGELKFKNGQIALFEAENLLFIKSLINPNLGRVNNEGTVICSDWLSGLINEGKIYVFNKYGKEIYTKKVEENIGYGFLSDDSKYAIFEGYGSINEPGHKIYVANLEIKETTYFKNFIRIRNAEINSKNEIITLIDNEDCRMEVDFNGKEVNNNYLNQLIEKKDIDKLLYYFRRQSNEIKFQDVNYLKFLLMASENKNNYYSCKLDKLYREIGEYYEFNGDIKNTIHYWEKAILINSKIGVIRKLERLKKY